jgi:peptidoglycan hydrolase-like protein with peptidoglycan-binding domain
VDPALWELLRAETVTDGTGIIEAIIRFARPGIEIPDVRIVSRFGTIATCRIRARDVIAVRARPDVVSLKAARGLSPGFDPAVPEMPGPAQPGVRPTDVRRSPALTLTGAGVVVASADWGVDVDSAAFRWPAVPATADADRRPGGTRFVSFWDQRDQAAGPHPDRYGYGTVHDRDEIDRALQGPRPYELLGYHPAIADPAGLGTHGTHVLDIAAGTGRAGGPAGIAPDADLIFVHLADRNTGGLASFGDSVRLLEAVDFISGAAGSQPCVINISAGRICGPKDGTTLVERAFDELLTATPGRFIVNSAGNYFRRRAHARGTIAPGEARSLSFVIDPADITLNELEIWYDGADEFAVRVDPPGHAADRAVCLGERSDLLVEGRVIGRVYHRKHDPNNGDNHIVAFIDPIGHAGNWTVTLEARRVSSGRFHAWIERDDSCLGCQARFTHRDSNSATTIGSITSSHLPLIVGAYDGHDPARPAAPFSSGGPSRDLRPKPDLAAPGVAVLAARSAPVSASRNLGLLTRKSGTSMATPHVTGAVALCLQAAGTRLSAGQIRSLVLGSCDPAPGSDPCRLGRGYLNIPRLMAGVQQALAGPASIRGAKEPTMDTEDIIALLAAAPATAYREYLYRPHGQFARWIGTRFEVVARPGQRIGRAPQAGDVLLQVRLGRIHPGRCIVLGDRDHHLAATPPKLAPGQLLLRPRRRAALTGPLPVEPAAEIPYLALSPTAEPWAAWPAGDPTEAITPVTTLTSPRFTGDSDLDAVAKGTLRLAAPGTSPYPAPVLSQGPAIAKIQQALIDLSYPLPQHGADGQFGAETGTAVTKYKTDRSITPNDPVIGRLTIASLDTDIIHHDQPTPPPPTPPPPPAPGPTPVISGDLTELARGVSMGLISDSATRLKPPAPGASIAVALSDREGWTGTLVVDSYETTASGINFPVQMTHGSSTHVRPLTVLDRLVWSDLKINDLAATNGTDIALPLTNSFVLGIAQSGGKRTKIAAGGVDLFPLETEIQTYATVVFGYSVDGQAGTVSPLNLSHLSAGQLSQFLTNHGNLGPISTASTAILAVYDLTLTSPKDDFQPKGPSPIGLANVVRLYPLLSVWSSRPLTSVGATLDMTRPAASPMEGMARGGAMGNSLYADVNTGLRTLWDDTSPAIQILLAGSSSILDLPLPNNVLTTIFKAVPSTRWNSIFAHYSLDSSRSNVTVVAPHIIRRTNTTVRQVWDRSRSSYIPTPVMKVERQGMFDNVHVAPVMDYQGALAYMAPLCQHDCLHIHWRWGEVYTDKPVTGWSGGRPYQKAGAPMIPENQTLRVSTMGPHVTYAPSAEAIPAQTWQVFMHHGTGYVSSLTPAGIVTPLMEMAQLGSWPDFNAFYYHNRMLETGGSNRAADTPRLLESAFGPLESM